MGYPYKILFRSFVKPFYRENAAFFVFVFTVMFYIVGMVDGAGLFEYHQTLVTGMLKNYGFLLFVFAAWFLYTRKIVAFITGVMHRPEYTFLCIYNCLDKAKQFTLFFLIEVWLLLPVLLYSVFIVITGWRQHLYLPVLLVVVFLLLLCFLAALRHVYVLNNLYKKPVLPRIKVKGWLELSSAYPVILLRFVANQQKIMWIGLKVFTCSLLYLIARNNTLSSSDIHLTFLFFNFGVFANGVLVFRIREFEETYLTFYRGVPVSLLKRLLEYALVYFILLLPEFITAGLLAPVHLQYSDAIQFSLCGYSLLLLMNSITFLQSFSAKEYLPVLLLIFSIQYIFLMAVGLTFLYLLLLVFAIVLFLRGYYKGERNVEK